MLRAVVWDVDGTIAETERDGHRVAFNEAFASHGFDWRWDVDEYRRLLAVAGGRERLLHDLATRSDAPADPKQRASLAASLHATKNAIYARLVAEGRVALRPGVRRLMDACAAAGIAQAIATTTTRGNVDALLHAAFGEHGTSRFATIVAADDAPAKKPDPLVYRIALERLRVRGDEAIAIEDSPDGVAAARAAGLAPLVTRSDAFRDKRFADDVAICDDLDAAVAWPGGAAPRVDVDALRAIAARG